MFLRYFGLREQPFGMTPDPRFLYLSSSHREALASLIYGIETGRGFLCLIAEPGMGKTTVLFQLMERLRNSARTVFLFQTQGDTRELLSNLIADLGLDPGDRDVGSLQRQLNEVLIQEARMGRQFVLVIDEAQNLDDSVLESVRMLSNFETSRSKLMQIVLAGQPALAEKLSRPELEQLRQRVSIICRLTPFKEDEVADYIQHRLETAGYQGGKLFTPEARAMIAGRCEGIPRNINNLCFHALSLAYAQGEKRVTGVVVEEVLSDLKLESLREGRPTPEAVQTENRKRVSGLEFVTLNSNARDGEGRVFLRGGRHYVPAKRRGVEGRRRTHWSPRWLFWAVTALTLVLAGEIFWAYLPMGTQRHAFTQFVDHTVGQAKEAASKYGPLKLNNAQGPTDLKTTVIHSDADGNSKSQNTDRVGSANSESSDTEDSNSTDLSYGKTADPSIDANDPAATAHSDVVSKQPSRHSADGPSTNDFWLSTQAANGSLIVESNVDGSVITINGRTRTDWQTPHIFTLPQGTYRVSVSQPGYSTWFRDVRVMSGNKRWVMADLQPPRGVIVIDTDPPGMQVFIDGKPYGPSEVETALSVGSHTYKVIPPSGEHPFEGTFVLKPGDILTRKIRWLRSSEIQPSEQNKPEARRFEGKTKSSKGREQS